MKHISFLANGKNESIKGIVVASYQGNTMLLDKPIGNQTSVDIKTTDIKDFGNLIASIVKKLDSEGVFESITLSDSKETYPILVEPENTIRLYVKRSGEDYAKDIIIESDEIPFQDIYQRTHNLSVLDLGFEVVDVPVDFKYTKNEVLNFLYRHAMLPHDYNRKINKVITKEIAKKRKAANGEPWAFWCSETGAIMGGKWKGAQYKAIYVSSELVSIAEAITSSNQ